MTVTESIVRSTGSIITQLLRDEAVFLYRVRGEFEWIQGELTRINRYLKDADRKAREGNDSIKGWVVDVMGVAYDADDAITFFVWMEEQRKRRTFIDKCLFFYRDLLNLHKAGVLIKAVKKNIEGISRSRSNFRLEEIGGGESHEASSSLLQQYRNATTSFEEELFVGFKRDTASLRRNLTRGESRRCVVSIVAMGGAGKTTLARKVYNNRAVKTHFGSNVAWVCVSQSYDIKELFQGIAEQAMELKKKDSAEMTESQLREKLREFLKHRKYLIVVDDIWNKEAWDLLKGAFPDGNEGSRILLTTRIEDVALYADRLSEPHKLPLLDKEESWALFLNIVFPSREKNGKPICPPQLEGIARQMVAKCGGLPLAIKVLGGLSFTTTDNVNEWRKALDHLKWQLSHEPKHFNDILALSYLDLPDYLKPCFLYLGIFPEDYPIPVKSLTKLWIAEGFVQAREKSSEEDVAEQYIGELAKRNMIQVIDSGESLGTFYGGVSSGTFFGRFCRVHDMLHDFAIKEAKRDGLFESDNNPLLFGDASAFTSALTCVRCLGIHHNSINEVYNNVWLDQSDCLPIVRCLLCFADRPPKVRSLLFFNDKGLEPQMLGCANWLRVLHLTKGGSEVILDDILGELVHLKYLRIDSIKSLPPCIDKLYNLQTLDLGWTSALLPVAVWSLRRLRCLIARHASFDGRPQLKLLQDLHTLELAAGDWIEEESLIKLSNLRNLQIYSPLGMMLDEFGEALINAVQGMVHLRRLQLEGGEGSVIPPFKPFNDDSQLEEIILWDMSILLEKPQISLEFPPMLTKLLLIGTFLKEDPMFTLGKLKNLCILSFTRDAYTGSKLTMPEQGFPHLKCIEFIELSDLEEWIVEEGAMPTLKQLAVHQCNKLKMLPEGLQDITTLKELIVRMPSNFCQRLKKNGGEDWHKIQHVPSVTALKRLKLPFL